MGKRPNLMLKKCDCKDSSGIQANEREEFFEKI
jgi:hypothetical protein